MQYVGKADLKKKIAILSRVKSRVESPDLGTGIHNRRRQVKKDGS